MADGAFRGNFRVGMLVHYFTRAQTMNREGLSKLLTEVQAGEVSVARAMERLRHLPYENLGFARMDNHRTIRQGFPEVIFCEGKTVEQVAAIAWHLLERHGTLLATRASREMYKAVKTKASRAVYHPLSRAIVVKASRPPRPVGRVLVVSAGTSDIPVAEEAAVTASSWGAGSRRDVRCRRGGDPPACFALPMEAANVIACRGHGWRPSLGHRRPGGQTGDRGADQHRLRGELSRAVGARSPC